MEFYIISGIFLLLGSLTGADPSCKSSPCISVDVYYEALCWDSMNFMLHKLAPSYPAFKDHLDINFVPYGKATHERNKNGSWVFTCQHGKPECQANKAQACALDVIKKTSAPESKQEHAVNLVVCAMDYHSPGHSVPECAKSTGLSESVQQKITNCVQSSAGDDLLAAHGDKTHSIRQPLQFVPTIVINGHYSNEDPWDAAYNFKKNICHLLKEGGKKPTLCA